MPLNNNTPFLQDYSGMAGAGSALSGFAEGFGNAQKQKMERIMQQAQMEALQTKMQRENDQSELQAAKDGMARTAEGGWGPAPLTPTKRTEMNLKAISGGARETGFTDEAGNPTYEANPDYWKTQQAQGMLDMRKQGLENSSKRLGLQERRFAETQNQNAASAGKNLLQDKLVEDMQGSRYSLDRGRQLLHGHSPLTYNNMNAVQQDVINGMTRGGQSSEGKVSREMQESWIGRWNNIMAKAGKYGENNDIRKQDPGLAKQVNDLLEEVDSTIANNISDRQKRLAGSYSSHSNPKVQSTVSGILGAPGLVQPGKLGASPEASAPAQDPQVSKFAADNKLDYAHALAIINARKAKAPK